jgi:phosphatidylglycerol---prolipoprotein diacylglyceryl transferase
VTFPVLIPIGPWTVHPHLFFESLSYFIGFRVYLALRRRAGDTVVVPHRWATLSCAAVGAAVGARLLGWLAAPEAGYDLPSLFLGGKTIVGGLIGGLAGVELVKLGMGIRRSTGDLYAPALALAIAIGRIGCFLTGVEDDTSGVPTALPWGMDLGDGIRRHPTQLYELIVLAAMVVPLWRLARRTMGLAATTGLDGAPAPPTVLREGDAFKAFMVAYMTLRLVIDFLKPYPAIFLGLGVLQWAAVATLLYYAPDIWRWIGRRPAAATMRREALQ